MALNNELAVKASKVLLDERSSEVRARRFIEYTEYFEKYRSEGNEAISRYFKDWFTLYGKEN